MSSVDAWLSLAETVAAVVPSLDALLTAQGR